jgi:hypothetical protein
LGRKLTVEKITGTDINFSAQIFLLHLFEFSQTGTLVISFLAVYYRGLFDGRSSDAVLSFHCVLQQNRTGHTSKILPYNGLLPGHGVPKKLHKSQPIFFLAPSL